MQKPIPGAWKAYKATHGYSIEKDIYNRPFIAHPTTGAIMFCRDMPAAQAILTEFNLTD